MSVNHDTRSSSSCQSPRARQVARWFGLRRRITTPKSLAPPRLKFSAGTITLITGPSGAGKSSLLRELRAGSHRRVLDIAAIDLPEVPIVDCFGDHPLGDTLLDLGRVGLGEAHSYLCMPSQLSEGQRWRLRLALAVHQLTKGAAKVHRQRPILIADEFAAMLDRITALVVARALRRMINAHPALAAIVATSHDDLSAALSPDVIVRCDFSAIHIVRS